MPLRLQWPEGSLECEFEGGSNSWYQDELLEHGS